MSAASVVPERRDRGAVTVEAAIALCALLVVFGVVLGGISTIVSQLRCTDAAGAAARTLARGQWRATGSLVDTLASTGARLTVRTEGRAVTVTVSAEPLGGLLPGLQPRGVAHALLEPGVDAPPPGIG